MPRFQNAIRIDIDKIVDAARASGANETTLEGLRQRLEVLNTPPDGLVDIASTGALKVLSRQWGSVFDDPNAPSEARDSMIAATRRALDQSTDFATRVQLGQWKIVADILEELQIKPQPNHELDVRQLATNEQIARLASELRNWREHFPDKGANFAAYYNAHRVACVVACPFKGKGCETNFNCWETRWGFCRMDLQQDQ